MNQKSISKAYQKSQQYTEEDSKRKKDRQKNCKTHRKQLTKWK